MTGDVPVRDDAEIKRYSVGTLTYTKMGLVAVFFWIIWGDFCWSLMETVMPALLPLTLKENGASDFAIGVIMNTIPYVLNAFITPIISFKSDRHRGRLGRRIPFLLYPTPFVTLFLILTAYAPQISKGLHAWLAQAGYDTISLPVVFIGVGGACMIFFQFFNMFVCSVYYYLWADVVPEAFMGRFMALFRLAGTLASMLWNYKLFGLSARYEKEIYIGMGVLYLAAFMLMCWRVKEGQYPPPPPQKHGTGFRGSFLTFFHECYSVPYYLWFFLGTTLGSVSSCAARTFAIFFFLNDLGLTRDQVGKINFWSGLASIVLLYPFGWLSDRLHPLRVVLLGQAGLAVGAILGFILIHDRTTLFVFTLALTIPAGLSSAAGLPMYAALLPKDRYGQFCAAQALFNAIGLILGGLAAAAFIQVLDTGWTVGGVALVPHVRNHYRYVYVWQAAFLFLSLGPMFLVYLGWRKHGGAKGYVAPSPGGTGT